MIYIVDIDQTICYTTKKKGQWDYKNSIPMKYRIDRINELYNTGHTVIYWTARGSGSGIDWKELTTNQLNKWGCKYHELRMSKPSYDVWIDDKALSDEEYFDG